MRAGTAEALLRILPEDGGRPGPRAPEPPLPEAEGLRLRAEYRAWRLDAGLEPPPLVELRFRRWQRLLARNCGVLFAPWSIWED